MFVHVCKLQYLFLILSCLKFSWLSIGRAKESDDADCLTPPYTVTFISTLTDLFIETLSKITVFLD